MFHLLVKFDGWASTRDTLGKDRVFEHTDDELARQFKPGGKLDNQQISRIPALFLAETGGNGSKLARVGYISRARLVGNEVNIEYSFDAEVPPIPIKELEALASDLDITNKFEFSRTHWAVKDADLFKALLKARPAPAKVAPKVFKLAEPDTAQDDLISVMMPFDGRFDKVYQALKSMAKDLEMKCARADDIWQHDVVIQDIVSLIERSRMVVCDCSDRNSNVFYEIGIAHTLGKEVVLITQSKDDIPFDLRHVRYVQYLNNAEGRRALVTKLAKRIETLMT